MEPTDERTVVFENVSKFYGEVLGVNRVSLNIPPGITGLVGPNGSGKTTLMNLMTGLLRPTRGRVTVLGTTPLQPESLFRRVGYCTQYDSFPRGFTGLDFLRGYLRVHGYSPREAREKAWAALEKVRLVDAATRKVAGYSKGMRQRVKLAQAMCHDPTVLVLDEPLNGLDPMARAEVSALFRDFAREGRFVIVSSHILHEVDMISDQVVLLNGGYVVAEGDIAEVRAEMPEHPIQVLIRCDRPAALAARLFEMDHVVEVKLQEDRRGLLIRTRDADEFYRYLNRAVLEAHLRIETVTPADDDVYAVYQYLIGSDGGGA
jgi:ABC-2 type transport system ATP-binding protein